MNKAASEVSHPSESLKNRTRVPKKFPIFILNLQCQDNLYHFDYRPSSCSVEFIDWDLLFNFLYTALSKIFEQMHSSNSFAQAEITTHLPKDEDIHTPYQEKIIEITPREDTQIFQRTEDTQISQRREGTQISQRREGKKEISNLSLQENFRTFISLQSKQKKDKHHPFVDLFKSNSSRSDLTAPKLEMRQSIEGTNHPQITNKKQTITELWDVNFLKSTCSLNRFKTISLLNRNGPTHGLDLPQIDGWIFPLSDLIREVLFLVYK